VNLSLLGAGAWGTALAASVAERHAACLWARDAAHAEAMRAERGNPRYLPGIVLPASLAITSDFEAAVAHAAEDGLLIIATPMAGLQEMLMRLPAGAAPVVWLCKGFQ